MLREFSIIIVILVIIIGGNILIQEYLVKSSEPIVQNLEELYEKIGERETNKEEIRDTIETVEEQWEDVGKIWTMIITHSELDQIEIALLNTKTAVEVDKLQDASIELQKSIFLLKHIQERDAFKIKNIF